MPEFLVCADCDRHVHASDASCPFCGSTSRRPTLKKRVSLPLRTLLATGAIGGAVAACGDDGGGTVALYGAPAPTVTSSSSASGTGGDGAGGQNAGGDMGMGGSDVALYGAPPTTGSGGAGGN